MDEDIAGTLKKYPPSEICDEWDACADYWDRHARDMYCEHCDIYWDIVESKKRLD